MIVGSLGVMIRLANKDPVHALHHNQNFKSEHHKQFGHHDNDSRKKYKGGYVVEDEGHQWGHNEFESSNDATQ
jgi:hypothetical protein